MSPKEICSQWSLCIVNLYLFKKIFCTAHLGLGFYYIICTVLQCDLPPLRPHFGEAPRPGPRFEPRTGSLDAGTLTIRFLFLSFQLKIFLEWVLKIIIARR